MRHILILFALLLLTFRALHLPAQRNGLASNNWGSLPGDGSVWAFNGQYAAGWQQPMRNLLKWSEAVDQWSLFSATVSTDSAVASNGTQTMDKLIEAAQSNAHQAYQSMSFSGYATLTLSVEMKASGRANAALNIYNGSDHGAWFDLSTGSVGTILGTNTTASISPVLLNGAYKCQITWSVPSGSGGIYLYPGSADNTAVYLGDGTSGVYIWGAQLLPGPLPLPYQRTGSGQTVADLAGVAPMTLGSNGSAADTNDPGVYVADGYASGLTFDGVDDQSNAITLSRPGNQTWIAAIRPTAVSDGLWMNGASAPSVSINADGKVVFAGGSTVTATNALTLNTWNVIGITVSGTTVCHYLNGVLNGCGTSASGNAFTALKVGTDGVSGYAGQIGLLGSYPYAWSAWQMAQYTRNLVEQFCPQRGAACDVKAAFESSGMWWREGEWAFINTGRFLPWAN